MKRKKLIRTVQNYLAVQGSKGNWDYDEYMRGYYNGIELVAAAIEERNPVFKEEPEQHITRRNQDER